MQTITHTFTVYDFSELSDEAKENVKKMVSWRPLPEHSALRRWYIGRA